MLEKGFQLKQRYVEWKEKNNETFRVTFDTMKGTSRRDHTGVDVKREDTNGRCIFTCVSKSIIP